MKLSKIFSISLIGGGFASPIFLQTSCSCSPSKEEPWVPYLGEEIYKWDVDTTTKISSLTNQAKTNIEQYITEQYNCFAIPNRVTEIAGQVFSDHVGQLNYLPKNIKYLSLGDPNGDEVSKCSSVAAYNFEYNRNLISVNFSKAENLQVLGAYLFRDCSNIQSITLPGSIKKINNGCFYGCKNLKSITFNNLNEIIKWTFDDSTDKAQFDGLPEHGTIYIRGTADIQEFKNMLLETCDGAQVFNTWTFKKIK